MPNLLIDGDGIGYRCAFAVESSKYLVLDVEGRFRIFETHKEAEEFRESVPVSSTLWSRKEVEPVENAIHLVDNVFGDLTSKFPDSGFVVFLTPEVGNYRELVAKSAKYKGNRDTTARPKHYAAVFQHLVKKHGAKYAVGQEADDSIGIAITGSPDSVVVSYDKDLLQLPGRHYNWVSKEEFVVSKKEAKLRFWAQVLAGDPTDNIKGCEGWGAVKSSRLVSECKSDIEAWTLVLNVYQEKYGNEEGYDRALETARLVYLRRKEGEIFNPPVHPDSLS